jgi:voltage-gated potassium channel
VGSTRSGSDEWSQTVSGGRRDEVMSSRRVLNSRCIPLCYLRVTSGGSAGEAVRRPRRISCMTQQRYRDLADWPLTLTALIFLAAYASQVIGRIEGSAAFWLEAVMWATWGIFAVDYLANLWLAPDRGSWFVRNLHELLIVALPFFRPLRLLRLVTLLSVLHRTLGDTLRGRVVTYVVGSATMLVFVGALAVLDVEQSAPEAKVLTFGDALWWAITTITTVGYGDMYPVTPLGRMVAAALMMSGIAVLGVVTASIASWLVQRVEDTAEAAAEAEEPVRAEVAELVAEIALLRRDIAELKDRQNR